jgi:hypothetical protein
LGRADKNALDSHLVNLMMHLLKWQYQAERRSRSWQNTIVNARVEIEEILDDTPALKRQFESAVHRNFGKSARFAARQMKCMVSSLPSACPYSPEELLNDDFLPETRHD